jgi:hypothetical protein
MKKLKLALAVFVSLSVAQPVMASGVGGKNMPPSASASMSDTNGGAMEWFLSWF